MHKMEELKEMLCEELDKITKKGELSAGMLDVVDKLTHSIKSIDTIMAMAEAEGEGGYSGARGRGRNARRDSMGRYSREGGSSYGGSYEGGGQGGGSSYEGGGGSSYGGSYRGGSSYRRGQSNRGYSRAEEMENLKEQLYQMEEMAQDDKSRQMVQRWIRQVDEG